MTRSTTGRPAAVAVLVGVLVALLAAPVGAVEAQGVRADVVEPDLLGEGSVLRPALPPGGEATYRLQLRNQRDQAVAVLVYGADATAEGEVASGTDNQGVGAWISADRSRVELEPQEVATVEATIRRPAGDEDGGWGAVVVQLADATRQDLGLERVERAALRVEVTADGSGDGVHGEVLGTDPSAGLLPGVLAVEVRFADTGALEDLDFDGSVVLSRVGGEDPSFDVGVGQLFPGGDVTETVEVDLPWYGLLGEVRTEAAVPGLTTRSAPVRVVVVPPWLALLLLLIAAAALLYARRSPDPLLDDAERVSHT